MFILFACLLYSCFAPEENNVQLNTSMLIIYKTSDKSIAYIGSSLKP